ncbi:MAG: hypothetical protein AAB526_01280, partial [Patescibacteria group bacterium]
TACIGRVKECIDKGDVEGVKKIMDFAEKYGIKIDLNENEEIKTACQKRAEGCINGGDIFGAKEIMDFVKKYGILIKLVIK